MVALSDLNSVFVSAVPEIDATRCLNSRHQGAGCVRCVALCPAMAIGFRGVTPEIDREVCVTCGVCLALCPTTAITAPTGFEIALDRFVEKSAESVIAIVCGVHSEPTVSGAPTVVRHGMCLGSLDPGHLLALAAPGERRILLDVTPCASCPLSPVQSLIEDAVGVANQLAAENPIGMIVGGEQFVPSRVLDGTHQGLTRRDLFGSVKRRREEAQPPMFKTGAAVDDRLPAGVPKVRRRLLRQMDRWAPAERGKLNLDGLPFAAVEADHAKCSGCSLCGRFCPTGSLAFHEAPGSFALGFRASLCIDCGICSVVCPEDAIEFGSELPFTALVAEDWSVLVTGPLTKCAVCGEPTRGESDELCHGCRGGRVDSLHDDAGVMKDFLSRIDPPN